MMDTQTPTPEVPTPVTGPDSSASRQRSRWLKLPQVRLRSIILLIAVIAAWTSYAINRREIASLNTRIKAIRPLARALEIDDPKQIAIVKMEELWSDDERWEVYLPEGQQYRVYVATREVDSKGFAPVAAVGNLSSGRHRLALERSKSQNGHHVVMKWDGADVAAVDEPENWDQGVGSTGGSEVTTSKQFPASAPVVVFRRRFMERHPNGMNKTSSGPTAGIQLWIDRSDSAHSTTGSAQRRDRSQEQPRDKTHPKIAP
jgi:hypothetical protein